MYFTLNQKKHKAIYSFWFTIFHILVLVVYFHHYMSPTRYLPAEVVMVSPGASWEPFTVSNKQYNQLLNKVLKQSSISLKEKARYYHIQFIVDSSFDKYRDQFEWMQAVCNKHRKGYNLKLEKVQKHIYRWNQSLSGALLTLRP